MTNDEAIEFEQLKSARDCLLLVVAKLRGEQEPVAYWKEHAQGLQRDYDSLLAEFQAQRTWVGLTDEEIAQGCKESWVTEQAWQSAVWWAEAKLKEKNT